MPSLQVRELPENIYNLLQKKARKENRSLAQEAIAILSNGLNTSNSHKSRRKELIADIENECPIMSTEDLPEPADLIREDRER